MWDDIAGDVGNGRPLSVRAQGAVRDYIGSNPSEYADVQPQPRNRYGNPGDPVHVATQRRLVEMAIKEFPNDRIHEGTSIKNQPGTEGLDRRPEVWVEDSVTHRVKKVYEAARKDASGEWKPRELDKKADYDRLGILSHFEEVK
jgi:hypothetical protein